MEQLDIQMNWDGDSDEDEFSSVGKRDLGNLNAMLEDVLSDLSLMFL